MQSRCLVGEDLVFTCLLETHRGEQNLFVGSWQ